MKKRHPMGLLSLFLFLMLFSFAQALTFEELIASYGFSYPDGYVLPDFNALVPEKEILDRPLPDLYIDKSSISYLENGSAHTLSFTVLDSALPSYNYAVHLITPAATFQRNVLYTTPDAPAGLSFTLEEEPSFVLLSLDTYGSVEEQNESNNILLFNLSELPFHEEGQDQDNETINVTLNLSLNQTFDDTHLPAQNSSEDVVSLLASTGGEDIPDDQPGQGIYFAVMPPEEQQKMKRADMLEQKTALVPLHTDDPQETIPLSPTPILPKAEDLKEDDAPSFGQMTGMVAAELQPAEKDIPIVAITAVLILFLSALSLTMVNKFLE